MRVDAPRGLPDAVVVGAYNGRVNNPRQPHRFVITDEQSSPSALYPDSRSQRKFLTIDRGRRDAPAVVTVTSQESPPKLKQSHQIVSPFEKDSAQTLSPVKALEHTNADSVEPLPPATGEVHTVVPATLAEGGAGKDGGGPGKTAKDFSPDGENGDDAWDIILEGTRGKLSEDKRTAFFERIPDSDHHMEQEESQAITNELIAVPIATTPKVFFTPSVENHIDRYSVDLDLIQRQLLKLRFDEQLAGSFAVIFQDLSEMNDRGLTTTALYSSHGLLDTTENDTTYYRMAFVLACVGDEEAINRSLWHEVGHGELDKIQGVQARNSWGANPHLIKRTKRMGLVSSASGTVMEAGSVVTSSLTNIGPEIGLGGMFVGAALIAAGVALNAFPNALLTLLDPNERYANRFADQMSEIKAIYINQ